MPSLNVMANKLLKALEHKKGIVYCLNKTQNYSKEYKRRFTRYTLHRSYIDEDGESHRENHYFNKMLDVVLFLADKLRSDDS